MKVIICEENYSYIEMVHTTLLKYAKTKGINAEFSLTTRKTTTVEKFIETEHAECYYISLDNKQPEAALQLIEKIRASSTDSIINIMSVSEEKLNDVELLQYDIFRRIEKTPNGTMKEELKKSFLNAFAYLKASDYF